MKHLIIIVFLFYGLGTTAQSEEAKIDSGNYKVVEVLPEFPGGINAFYSYLYENLEYPAATRRLGIEGRVYVQFVITETGYVDTASVNVIKGIHYAMDQEAARVIKEMPRWTPGRMTEDSEPVSVRMVIPFTCTLPDEPNTKKKRKKN